MARNSSDSDDEKKNRRRKSWNLPCTKVDGDFGVAVDSIGEEHTNLPHLVVLVNGIIGSVDDWRFMTEQMLKCHSRDVIIHCSRSNQNSSTFDGVDVMGERLAEEVISVIKRHPSVQKISFIGHSLGGLVARYAIAKLYGQDLTKELSQENGDCKSDVNGDIGMEEKLKSKIAGLEPVNFITFATPHLGSRWPKQVPLFRGFYTLEKMAARISGIFGRSGKQLFLTDGENGKPPLLLQMVRDSEDLKFMSALLSFKHHVAYANTRFDDIVGWNTASLRHHNELLKIRHISKDEKYPHIVHVESSKTSGDQQAVDGCNSFDMEEEMIQAMTKVSWKRVDVRFNEWSRRFAGHSTIVVKRYRREIAGADVVQHMIDNFVV